MVKKIEPRYVGKFLVLLSQGDSVLRSHASTETFDEALAVALQLHSLLNLEHLIVVRDSEGVEVARLVRLSPIPIRSNLPSNGR